MENPIEVIGKPMEMSAVLGGGGYYRRRAYNPIGDKSPEMRAGEP